MTATSKGDAKKVTLVLPATLLLRLKDIAAAKRVRSVNSAVREAVERYIAELDREDFSNAMQQAARDPEFLRDLRETEEAFQHADSETARMMPPW